MGIACHLVLTDMCVVQNHRVNLIAQDPFIWRRCFDSCRIDIALDQFVECPR